jgi:uncharacterized protein YndB with AHSA1/START domain
MRISFHLEMDAISHLKEPAEAEGGAAPADGGLSMAEPFVVRREIEIAAPQATVFAFLTDPQKILRWMGTDATVEPHLDGLYLVNVTGKDVAEGRFTEVIPVHRLAYSFGWKGSDKMPPGSSLIEIDLTEREGGTLLHMTHSGLPDPETCAAHERGWTHHLGRLAAVASGGDPGADRGKL